MFLFPSQKIRSTENYLPPQVHQVKLVAGFNPFEKYWSNCIISPGRDEHKQYLQPPPSLTCFPLTFEGPLHLRDLFSTKIQCNALTLDTTKLDHKVSQSRKQKLSQTIHVWYISPALP